MAAIGKIREKSTLLLVIIGLALLAFVLGDFFRNSSQGSVDQSIGEIYGEPINYNEYNSEESAELNNTREQYAQQGRKLDERTANQIRENVWNRYVQRRLLDVHTAKIGLTVHADEVKDMVMGEDISEQVKNLPVFKDTNGVFSIQKVKQFLSTINSNPASARQWANFEISLQKGRLFEKYNSMIEKGLYVTSFEAKQAYIDREERRDIKYVFRPYSDIEDKDVTVSDADLLSYFNEHKNEKRFEQKDARRINYVFLSMAPRQNDYQLIETSLNALKPNMLNDPKDSIFVLLNSDSKFFSNNFEKLGFFPAEIDTQLVAADSGSIVGPFLFRDAYVMLKKLDQREVREVKVRRVLLGTGTGAEEDLSEKADSIQRVAKRNGSLENLINLSTDPAAGSNQGVIEWFAEDASYVTYAEEAHNASTGDIIVVKKEDGFHIVEIMEERISTELNTARIVKNVTAQEGTRNAVISSATNVFYIVNKGEKTLDEVSKSDSLDGSSVNLTRDDSGLNGVSGSGSIMNWAFSSAEGEVCKPIQVDNGIVVAVNERIIRKGIPELDDVKEIVRAEAIKAKKAEKLAAEMVGGDLNTIAEKGNTSVTDASVSFSQQRIGSSTLATVGEVFKLKVGAGVSAPIIDRNSGVYVVSVDAEAKHGGEEANTEQEKNTLKDKIRQSAYSETVKAMKENANVIDNRIGGN